MRNENSPILIFTEKSIVVCNMRLGLVDGDVTAVEVLAIYAFDHVLHGLLVVEGDEAEVPGPLDLTVVDDLRFGGGGKSRPHGSGPDSTS
ncbi:hypothetical protein ACE6H2_020199 [Prunus campanulata]